MTDLAADAPITQEEMVEMFGETMPIAAINLLWTAPGTRTLAELRAELRADAAERRTATLLTRLFEAVDPYIHEIDAVEVREALSRALIAGAPYPARALPPPVDITGGVPG